MHERPPGGQIVGGRSGGSGKNQAVAKVVSNKFPIRIYAQSRCRCSSGSFYGKIVQRNERVPVHLRFEEFAFEKPSLTHCESQKGFVIDGIAVMCKKSELAKVNAENRDSAISDRIDARKDSSVAANNAADIRAGKCRLRNGEIRAELYFHTGFQRDI